MKCLLVAAVIQVTSFVPILVRSASTASFSMSMLWFTSSAPFEANSDFFLVVGCIRCLPASSLQHGCGIASPFRVCNTDVEVLSSFRFALRTWRCFFVSDTSWLGFAQQGKFADNSGRSVSYAAVLEQVQHQLPDSSSSSSSCHRKTSGSQTAARRRTALAASPIPAAAVKIEPLQLTAVDTKDGPVCFP